MKLTTRLAWTHIKGNRVRTVWTLVGVAAAAMMITAVFGFAESARVGIYNQTVRESGDWHIQFQWISEDVAGAVAADEDVTDAKIISGSDASGTLWYGVQCRLARPTRNYENQFAAIAERHGVEYDLHFCRPNEEILGLEGYGDDRVARQFYGIAAILAAIVIAMSVVVISNAFKVSAGERVRQFGLLKSAGGTRRHIMEIVLKEGFILSAAGIPVGIAAGLGLETAALTSANAAITAVSQSVEGSFKFGFTAAPVALTAAAVFSFAAVVLSAYFPARKAAKIPAIEAVRQTGEVRIRARTLRSSKLINKLFGFEGTLAEKSMKRSKRAYRATVVALTVSVMLFIACGEFSYSFLQTLDTGFSDLEITARATFLSSDEPLPYERLMTLTARLEEYDAAVYFQGYSRIEKRDPETVIPEDMMTGEFKKQYARWHAEPEIESVAVEYVVADSATYNDLISQAGAVPGEAILLNRARTNYNNESYEYTPFNFKQTTLTVRDENGYEKEIFLAGEARDLPERFLNGFGGLLILVPELDASPVYWYIDAADSAGFTKYANELLTEELPDAFVIDTVDVAAHTASQMAIFRFVTVFIYAFVGLLALIALTSVVSVISANMRSRSREFAVLRSAGMTRGGLRRMLDLECVIYAAKSFAYGLVAGSAAAVCIYKIFSRAEQFDFVFPWAGAVVSIALVFAVTFVTMRVTSARRGGESLVETIRAHDGV
ncbi:MAG: ABC transporter permease [Gracilibacteraceae bacterium]|jgi:putative ABC transport system permease protein|nr:ABC transporter permease [Gracilibacteraceae bacterium]